MIPPTQPLTIAIINGPNLNMLGLREPDIYGSQSFDTVLADLRSRYPHILFDYYQSNVEGELVDRLQQVGIGHDGIILNAGAYTHTSIALHDAIKAIPPPVVEVHISNIYQRETYRHTSIISSACVGQISGFGVDSYRLAVEALWGRIHG